MNMKSWQLTTDSSIISDGVSQYEMFNPVNVKRYLENFETLIESSIISMQDVHLER